ncbi:MAG: carboxymuconolactone decarboxylase family protein [Methanobacteriota archaeon]
MTTTINKPNALPENVRREITEAFGFVPGFVNVLPPKEAELWWSAIRDFQLSEETNLDGKTKELIGLGVASQIPCHFCVLFHTEAARLNGASEHEIQEAIFMAGLTRLGSTILNGVQYDSAAFDKELREIVSYVKRQMQSGKGH